MPSNKRERLDALLVTRGLADSRERAQRLIRAGEVRVDGVLFDKPGKLCAIDAAVTLRAREKFVGRGGYKLEAVLREFPVPVPGCTALDIGASTGGFTDCLLQNGAARVIAVDVGRGQLHASLQNDPRVTVIDGVNARYLDAVRVPTPVDLVVMDVSFISLRLTMPPAAALLKPGGFFVTLIKPQFEAGRGEVPRGGVIRDAMVHARVVQTIRAFGEECLGLIWRGHCQSPIRGAAGNIEFLALWEKPC